MSEFETQVELFNQQVEPAYLLQEDGISRFLLEDGSGFLLLEPGSAAGIWIEQPAATGLWVEQP